MLNAERDLIVLSKNTQQTEISDSIDQIGVWE